MCHRRALLWIDSDLAYARSLARILRTHIGRVGSTTALSMRIVESPDSAWPHMTMADVLIGDPKTGAGCIDLFAWWQRERLAPAVALSAHFTTRQCVQLHGLRTMVVTKDGAFAEARDFATMLAGALALRECPPQVAPTDSIDRLLSDIAASGSSYTRFLERLEQHAIRTALKREGSVKRAAESLGMRRSTLMSKMAKLGIANESDRRPNSRAKPVDLQHDGTH